MQSYNVKNNRFERLSFNLNVLNFRFEKSRKKTETAKDKMLVTAIVRLTPIRNQFNLKMERNRLESVNL